MPYLDRRKAPVGFSLPADQKPNIILLTCGHGRQHGGPRVWRGRANRAQACGPPENRLKHSLLVDRHGVPLAMRTAGANASDHTQIIPLLPEMDEHRPALVCCSERG